jgi:hypothetical protein
LVLGVAVVSPLAWLQQRSLSESLTQALGEKTDALGEKSQALALANQESQAAKRAREQEKQQRITAQMRLAENCLHRGIAACEQSEIDEGLHWMVRALAVLPEGGWPELERAIRTSISSWKPRMHQLVAHRNLAADGLLPSSDGRQVVAFQRGSGSVVFLDASTGLPSDAQAPRFEPGPGDCLELARHSRHPAAVSDRVL